MKNVLLSQEILGFITALLTTTLSIRFQLSYTTFKAILGNGKGNKEVDTWRLNQNISLYEGCMNLYRHTCTTFHEQRPIIYSCQTYN